MAIQQVDARVPDRPADRHRGAIEIVRALPERRIDRGLRRSIEVHDRTSRPRLRLHRERRVERLTTTEHEVTCWTCMLATPHEPQQARHELGNCYLMTLDRSPDPIRVPF